MKMLQLPKPVMQCTYLSSSTHTRCHQCSIFSAILCVLSLSLFRHLCTVFSTLSSSGFFSSPCLPSGLEESVGTGGFFCSTLSVGVGAFVTLALLALSWTFVEDGFSVLSTTGSN